MNDDRGSITAFVAVIATALVLVAGLAYDGGQVLATHAEVRSHAAKASRAGAQAIDLDHLHTTGVPTLDPAAAEAAAHAYLDRVGAQGRVVVDGDTVTVTVTAVQRMNIIPGPDRTITGVAAATVMEEATP
jgi:hypothetical protein